MQTLLLHVLAGLLLFYAGMKAAPLWETATRQLRARAIPSYRWATRLARVHTLMRAVVDQPSAEREPRAIGQGRDRSPIVVGLLLGTVILALFVRTIHLDTVPFGFFCDEASNALDAYLIGHTLHDQHGTLLPVFFQSLNDWRGGFHMYFEVPFMLVFGLSEFAVRCGSAVEGTLTVVLTYLFVSRAFNRPLGLLSAFLLAIAPWHILVSRMGFEAISLPLATALALALLYTGLGRPRVLALGLAAGALGIYTYQPARLFTPLLLVAWCLIYFPWLRAAGRTTLWGLAGVAVVLLPTVKAMYDGIFFSRAAVVMAGNQSLADRLATFWVNYQAHFSRTFLIDPATGLILRHYIRGYGMLYPAEYPFLLLGLAVLIARHRRADLFVLAWVALYPVATAIASQPFAHRSIAGVIVAQVLIAQGAYTAFRALHWVLGRLRVRARLRGWASLALAGLAVACCLSSLGGFMHAYLVDYPRYSSGFWGWQSGPRQFVATIKANEHRYAHFYMDGFEFNHLDELMRFYTLNDPSICATCDYLDMTDATAVDARYAPGVPELWLVPVDVLPTSPLIHLPHRVVGRYDYPDGSTGFVYIATGPATTQQQVSGSAAHPTQKEQTAP